MTVQTSAGGAADLWERQDALELRALDTAPSCARLHAKALLSEWGLSRIADEAELVISELVTNAYRITAALKLDTPISLRLWTDYVHLVLEVWDGAGHREPKPGDQSTSAESGRGLAVVTAIAERWGVRHVEDGGKIVFALIKL